jgi:hypothetical protein
MKLVACLIALSVGGCSSDAGPEGPATNQPSVSLEADRTFSPEIATAVHEYFGPKTTVERVLRVGDIAFALVVVDEGDLDTRYSGHLAQESGIWENPSFSGGRSGEDPSQPSVELPASGSTKYVLGLDRRGGINVVWGYLDTATFTALNVVNSDGTVLDSDVPTDVGAVIALLPADATRLELIRDGEVFRTVEVTEDRLIPES